MTSGIHSLVNPAFGPCIAQFSLEDIIILRAAIPKQTGMLFLPF